MRTGDEIEAQHKRGARTRKRRPTALGEQKQHYDGAGFSDHGKMVEYTLTREEYQRMDNAGDGANPDG